MFQRIKRRTSTPRVDKAKSAIALEESVKSGYLIKRAVVSGENWRRRYFVLTGNTLTYYKNHKTTNKAKGDLLFTVNAGVIEIDDGLFPHCFEVVTPFRTLRVAASSEEEKQSWMGVINTQIEQLTNTHRGYLDHVVASIRIGDDWRRKFFIINQRSITYHSNHNTTSKIQGVLRLTPTSVLQELDTEESGKAKFAVTSCGAPVLQVSGSAPRRRTSTGGRQLVMRARSADEREEWMVAINDAITEIRRLGAGDESSQTAAISVRRGDLMFRAHDREDDSGWDHVHCVLTSSRLECHEDALSVEPSNVFIITPSCAVFETNLKQNSFELVTDHKVLHVEGRDADDTREWISAIRTVISSSSVQTDDPIMRAAHGMVDKFYEVVLEEKKSLGLVLERVADCAIVKRNGGDNPDVKIGSTLTQINGESVITRPYGHTMAVLKGWEPPLRLQFRLPPTKSGVLNKLARGRRHNVKNNWKLRKFVLEGGWLRYFAGSKNELKGEISLKNASVSLAPYSETGKYFCFRLVRGPVSLTMQGLTVDEMMAWTSTLNHAIAVASGGGYLLAREHLREQEEEKAAQAAEAARQAESEAEAHKKAEAAAAAAVEQAAAALRAAREEHIKAEAEHDARLAEEAKRKADAAARAKQEAEEKRAKEEAEAAEAQARAEELAEAEEAIRLEREYREEQQQLEDAAKLAEENAAAEELEAVVLATIDSTTEVKSEGQLPTAAAAAASCGPRRRKSLIDIAHESTAEGAAAAVAANSITDCSADSDGDDDDDDDGDDDDDDEEKELVAEGAVPDDTPLALNEELLDCAFDLLDNGSGYLNPMAFCKVVRMFDDGEVGRGSMYEEMALFSLFNKSSNGAIDREEFRKGFMDLQTAGEHCALIEGLVQFGSGNAMCL